MNENERLQFTQDLIKAIEDAQKASQTPKSQSSIARDTYQKLQFDFPLVTIEELQALVNEYQTTESNDYKLTPKYIQVLREGAAPLDNLTEQPANDAAVTQSDPLRIAYQKVYAIALLKTLLKVLLMPRTQAESELQEFIALSKAEQQESHRLVFGDDDDDQDTASTINEQQDDSLATILNLLASHIKYQYVDEKAIWDQIQLADMLNECISATRRHPEFLQLVTVAQELCAVVHDRIIHRPTELPMLDSILKSLDITVESESTAIDDEAAAAALRVALQVTASLAGRLTASSAKRSLWKTIQECLLPGSAALLQWRERQRKKQSASSMEDFDAAELHDAVITSRIAGYYIIEVSRGPQAASIVTQGLLKSGLYRSLVLLFIRHGTLAGSEPLHHTLRLAAASSKELYTWADAVPGFKDAMNESQHHLHTAIWAALGGNDDTLVAEIQTFNTITGLIKSMPTLHRTLSILAEVHAAAKSSKPWGAATDGALRELGMTLRQPINSSTDEVADIVEVDDDNDEDLDAKKLEMPVEMQARVLEERAARRLQPECVRLVKTVLEAPGVSGKAD